MPHSPGLCRGVNSYSTKIRRTRTPNTTGEQSISAMMAKYTSRPVNTLTPATRSFYPIRAARSTALTKTVPSLRTIRSMTAPGRIGIRSGHLACAIPLERITTPTGRLFIGDVGGNENSVANKEEVNLGVAGANYGWPDFEGSCPAPCSSPIYFYSHNGRDACITGGFVYHGTQFPSSYQGNYFFADYTQNWIRRLTFDGNGNVNGVFNFEPADGSVDGPYGDIVYLTEGPDGRALLR